MRPLCFCFLLVFFLCFFFNLYCLHFQTKCLHTIQALQVIYAGAVNSLQFIVTNLFIVYYCIVYISILLKNSCIY